MSRFAKIPVRVPPEVTCELKGNSLHARGKLGEAVLDVHQLVSCKKEEEGFFFVPKNEAATARALSGTMHRLAQNMLKGVSDGFEKAMELRGVGYRVEMAGARLKFALGFAHPVFYDLPEGIKATVNDQTHFVLKGIDKQKTNQAAAEIKALRPPDPYKGKGIRYTGEEIILKEAKKK